MLPYYYNISSFTSSYYFQLPPPPLSSFDLLFWLGGGAWMQKVREHASIARSEQKKNFDPWGGV